MFQVVAEFCPKLLQRTPDILLGACAVEVLMLGDWRAAAGGAPASGSGNNGHGGSFPDNVVNSALRYRAQAPLVDSLLQEIGITGGDLRGISDILGGDRNGETPPSSEE